MVLTDLIKDGNCFDGNELLYQEQTDQATFLKGHKAFCLASAKDCKYFIKDKGHDYCKAYIEIIQEVYK